MAYWVDDGFDTWPESIRAGTAALGLYLRCGAWISRAISGGHIAEAVVPVDVAAMYGSKEWITRLCDVGLWEHVEDGYADRRYHSMGNPTPSKLAEQRKAKAERQRRWLEGQKAGRPHKTNQRQARDASQDVSTDIAPTLPSLRKGGRAPASPGGARVPRCPTCGNDPNSAYHRRVCLPAEGVPA